MRDLRSRTLRLVVENAGGSPSPASLHLLAENEIGEPAIHGVFESSRGEIFIDDLATYVFGADATVVEAYAAAATPRSSIAHSFYATATPLVAWAIDGLEVLHASAVLRPDGVIGLCGPSGSGKSTLAHGLGTRGLTRFAEDALAFHADAAAPTAVALPFTVNLRAPSRAHLAAYGPLPIPGAASMSSTAEAPLAALILLEPWDELDEPSSLDPVSPADALVALMPNAYRFPDQPVDRERRMLDGYLRLVASVPVYRLTYAHDFADFDRLLDLLESPVPVPAR